MNRLFALIALAGCGERTELSRSEILDRVRLLGARAEVDEEPDPVLGTRAEPRPGDTVTFSSLSYFPSDETYGGTAWVGCLPEGELAYGCEVDEDAFSAFDELDESSSMLDFASAIETAREAGLLGFEPLFEPEWSIPDNALDSLSEEERLEGLNAFINVTLFPETENTEEMDNEDLEIGFKRMPVSEALTPNHNPDISDFVVAGVSLQGAAGFTARTGHTYIIEPLVPDGHTETYTYKNSAGEDEYRSEDLYFLWYTEAGAQKTADYASFDQPLSLAEYPTVEWTAPSVPGVLTLYAVVRDRRGGLGWRSLKVNVL